MKNGGHICSKHTKSAMSLSGHTVVCIFSTHFQLVVVQAKFYSVEKENYRKQIIAVLTSDSDASGDDSQKVQVVSLQKTFS